MNGIETRELKIDEKNKRSQIIFERALEESGGIWGWVSFGSCFFTAVGSTIYYLAKKDYRLVKLTTKLVAIDFFLLLATAAIFVILTALLGVDSYRNKTGIRDMGTALTGLYIQSKKNYTKPVIKLIFILIIMSGLEFGFAMGAGVFIGFNK